MTYNQLEKFKTASSTLLSGQVHEVVITNIDKDSLSVKHCYCMTLSKESITYVTKSNHMRSQYMYDLASATLHIDDVKQDTFTTQAFSMVFDKVLLDVECKKAHVLTF